MSELGFNLRMVGNWSVPPLCATVDAFPLWLATERGIGRTPFAPEVVPVFRLPHNAEHLYGQQQSVGAQKAL